MMNLTKAEQMWVDELLNGLYASNEKKLAEKMFNSMPNILDQNPELLSDLFEYAGQNTLDNSMSRLIVPFSNDFRSQALNKYVTPYNYTAPTGSPVNMNTPTSLQAPVNTSPTQFNITNPEKISNLRVSPRTSPNTVTTKTGGLKGWFANTKNRVQSGGPLLDVNGPGLQNIKDARTKALGARLWNNGPKVSTAANVLNAGIQGAQAVKGLYDNSQTDTDISDLKQDIRELKLSNPMYANNLTPDQLKTLRKLDSGTQGANFGDALEGGLKGIPKALFSALMGGLTGNIPGAIISSVGSLVNSGIEGYGKAQQEQVADLQGLYESLNQGYSDYRSMKRPSNLYTGGLQSRYRNMYN